MRVTYVLLSSSILSCVLGLNNLPLTTSGRWIKDNRGETVTYVGSNWPGHMSAMIPEGLQYQSIATIVGKIKGLGMNSIRLTYATEMVDDILDRGGQGNLPLKASLIKGLGERNGSDIFQKVIRKNPSFTEKTTRLEIFDAIAAECEKQGIILHLDNHISKAMWCCDTKDGNSWPGDQFYDSEKWKRGWRFMANHTRSWSAMASVGLRNELRSPDNNAALKSKSYNWSDWYDLVKSCAEGVSAANPNLLVFLSGLGFDTDLGPIPTGGDLGGGKVYRKSDFAKDKVVLELHNYQNREGDCSKIKGGMVRNGWNALNSNNPAVKNVFPVVMTEFGFEQDPKAAATVYATCLKDFFVSNRAGWMYWVFAGSYYNRQNNHDSDEKWGMLNHDWSDWRSPAVIQTYFKPMIRGTLKVR
ncbi:cellulase family protein [Tothia fuscella]|uniref:Cellulase family protein n=1 Tax=Tothia fuscella TaxID=1048955 RepID=A0A9P4P2U1_9PEZI|nr:cellulase family protein [Tothia fuscella]